jgi:hypothetical protein
MQHGILGTQGRNSGLELSLIISRRLSFLPSNLFSRFLRIFSNVVSPLTTEIHIQDRYCKRFLGIDNTAAAVKAYDDRRVAQEWSVLRGESRASRPENHPNTGIEPAQSNPSKSPPSKSPPTESLSRDQEIPRQYVAPSQGPASLPIAQPLPTSQLSSEHWPSAPPSLKSNKRIRGNSFDSNSSTTASYYTGRSASTNFSHPQLQRFEMQLRDSGFFSSSSASDTTSLLSRMSRLSIEVKLCEVDHTRLGPGKPCSICRYPEPRPKPLVYVAPEYATPQRADVVDADDMDNGIMTRNANAKI